MCRPCQADLGEAEASGTLESGTFHYYADGTGYGVTDCHAQRTGLGEDDYGIFSATETCNGN